MANKFSKEMNVHERLLNARVEIANKDIRKTGINRYTEFTYFTLEDITPPILEVSNNWRIAVTMGVTGNAEYQEFYADVVNLDNPNDMIRLTSPFMIPDPKFNDKGNALNARTQDVGSALTYMRRYLLMLTFDIIEGDALEVNHGKPADSPAPVRGKPATTKEKEAVQTKLAAADKQAPKTLTTSLKKKLTELVKVDPEQKDMVKKILDQTNNLEKITKKECEGLIVFANEAISKAKE